MIRFTTNWEKLGWTIFTTIRKNTGSKRVGQVHTIKTPAGKFNAKVIGLYPIKKAEITDALAGYDADTDRDGLISMLEQWYGKYFDDFVLITLWATMSYRQLKEEYGEGPEDHFDDPAEYWDSMGDHHRANAIRAKRRKIENGDLEEEDRC